MMGSHMITRSRHLELPFNLIILTRLTPETAQELRTPGCVLVGVTVGGDFFVSMSIVQHTRLFMKGFYLDI